MASLVYILTGSNMGNSLNNLELAARRIHESCGKVLQKSSVYKTAAWGNTSQNAFLNQVIAIETFLNPQELLSKILSIETEMGRVRNEKWEPRVIDIDMLFFGTIHLNEPNLIIPHPYIQHRKFTLIPLVEIAPQLIHPVLKQTMISLLTQCEDELMVEKLDVN